MNDYQGDPRLGEGADGFIRDEQPVVGSNARGVSPLVILAVFAALAIALFLFLNARRTTDADSLVAPSANETSAAPPPPPLELTARPTASPPVPVALPQVPVAPPAAPAPPDDTVQRLHAPPVVVDLQSGRASAVPIAAMSASAPAIGSAVAGEPAKLASTGDNGPVPGVAAGTGPAGAGLLAANAASPLLRGANGAGGLSPNEQFAARASEAAPEPAIATQMTNLGTTITQGATIPAVLETAINSDLPGYARAMVSRDVLGFDGKNVLIARGSRVIGQYRNALSLGQSRVFVIWTRVIRPDGVTVQIGSPGDDALGRGGLTGEVNTHFFARFGGSVLLSVLNAGVAAVAGTPTTQISIGSPAAAAGAAATATIPTSSDILPTIKVEQGAAINIFVARDLDFSAVQAVK